MESAEIGGLRLAYEVKGSDRNGTVVLELMTSLPPSVLRDEAEQVAKWWELLGAHEESWTSPDGVVGHSAAAVQWLKDGDHMARWAEITVPVLVACFENDLFFPPAAGRAAAAAIPRGQFIEISEAAHGGLLTHPNSVH